MTTLPSSHWVIFNRSVILLLLKYFAITIKQNGTKSFTPGPLLSQVNTQNYTADLLYMTPEYLLQLTQVFSAKKDVERLIRK